jgi:hypothetical protein
MKAIGITLLALVALVCSVPIIKWLWTRGVANSKPGALPGAGAGNSIKVEAELMEAATPYRTSALPDPAAEKRCRACAVASPLAGWRRPSTIAVAEGFVGWSRRIRGLPPLYVRVRPPFAAEDLCADCSNVRDSLVDKKLVEVNLSAHQLSEVVAREAQKFAVTIDDDLRESVTHSDKRKRLSASTNSSR